MFDENGAEIAIRCGWCAGDSPALVLGQVFAHAAMSAGADVNSLLMDMIGRLECDERFVDAAEMLVRGDD